MYPVSEAFLQAVQENTRRYYWTGEIRTKGGAVYPFGYPHRLKTVETLLKPKHIVIGFQLQAVRRPVRLADLKDARRTGMCCTSWGRCWAVFSA